ncbi:solute carrier family 3 member 2b [Hemiscyllium ocellatum]|uniref:solute carrier family 3 member 2b n=1 Tax=Hemiscyllium ocellatum TaxID=170820 RepID=UPI002966AE5F|nr:solute carrier family 3 member 2b [Hemiscyllium ocellatum]
MSSEAGMKDAELGLKEVELNEVDQEKLPMTAGLAGDTNGALKGEKGEASPGSGLGPATPTKFTGLSKDELLAVASSPAWVRSRWLLLTLFWLAWLAMLAGAVVIIVQAPRCRPLPPSPWWQRGGLYRIHSPAFQDSDGDGEGDLAGVSQRMEEVAALKVKGIIIGPIHQNVADMVNETRLNKIDSTFGTLEQMEKLLEVARRKGLKVILDLTPNYKGKQKWFGINFNRTDGGQDVLKEKEAFQFWLKMGVDGLSVSGIEEVLTSAPHRVIEWQNLTKNFSGDDDPRIFIAGTAISENEEILQLLNRSDTDLFFSYYLRQIFLTSKPPVAKSVQQSVEKYIENCGKSWPSWALSGYEMGHMASSIQQHLHGLVHMMLFTLPGTPFIYYGDEIGLEDNQVNKGNAPWMLWNNSANGGFTSKQSFREAPLLNQTVQGQKSPPSLLSLFKKLSLLKIKERSLQFGEFQSVHSKGNVYGYTRVWDQSDRFLVLVNLDTQSTVVTLEDSSLPAKASIELSSNTERSEGEISLTDIHLNAGEGLLLNFPYVA